MVHTRRGEGDVAYFHVFQTVLLAYAPQHVLLAALLQLAGQQQLVEDEIGLLEVEDNVKFAHVAVVLVHLLDITMHDLEGDEFIVGGVAAGDAEKGGVAAVNDLGVLVFEEIAHARTAGEDQLRHVFHDLGLVFGRECGEPFGQTLPGVSPVSVEKEREGESQSGIRTTLPCRESRMRYLMAMVCTVLCTIVPVRCVCVVAFASVSVV